MNSVIGLIEGFREADSEPIIDALRS